jgi:hypothetical protein
MGPIPRPAPVRLAWLVAGAVVLLLALGPFAAPSVDTASQAGAAQDHPNDVPVIRPSGSAGVASVLTARPTSRAVLAVLSLVLVLSGPLAVPGALRWDMAPPGPPAPGPPRSRRGPPLLPA